MSIKPYPKNPRKISEAAAVKLAADLATFGDLGGIVQEMATGQLVGGHQRLRVLFGEEAGAFRVTDADIEIVNEFDAPDIQGTVAHGFILWRGFRYAYRRVVWDAETLREANVKANLDGGDWDWQELATWDAGELHEWGFDAEKLTAWDADVAALRAMDAAQAEEETLPDAEPQLDRAEELQAAWQVQVGDVWQLGAHFVTCGDCRESDVVARVMRGEKAEMIWTDPPYGVAIGDKNTYLNTISESNRVTENLKNDNLDEKGIELLLSRSFSCAASICSPGGAWYVTAPPGPLQLIFGYELKKLGIFRQTLQWVKNNSTFSPLGVCYHWQAEPIFFGWLPGAAHRWYGGRKQTTVWNIDRPLASPEHPTIKPVELVARAIENSSLPYNIVYDPFLGSGTTIIACEQLNRKCRGIELEPRYVAVALQRFQDVTGITPVKIA